MICARSFAFSLRRLAGLDHTSLRPQKRGCLLLGTGPGEGEDGGGRGEEGERVKARPRIPPEKDRRDRGPPPEQRKC